MSMENHVALFLAHPIHYRVAQKKCSPSMARHVCRLLVLQKLDIINRHQKWENSWTTERGGVFLLGHPV